jgi:hypothetical protein
MVSFDNILFLWIEIFEVKRLTMEGKLVSQESYGLTFDFLCIFRLPYMIDLMVD